MEVQERHGAIVMLPRKRADVRARRRSTSRSPLITANQAWFWTPEWQRAELKAEEDIRAGRLSEPFRDINDLKKHLSRRRS